MADREVQRRPAAILAADVAGYTRLMEQNTDGTVQAWQDAHEDVINPIVGDQFLDGYLRQHSQTTR